MTHRCRQTDDRVLARLSGEVTDPVWADEVQAVRLAGCDGCAQRLEEAEAFSAEAFAAFSLIPFPSGGADRVLTAVAAEVAQGGAARPEMGSSEVEGLRETDDSTLAGPLTKAPAPPAPKVVQAPWASGWSAVLRIAAALLFTTSFVYLGVEGLRRAGPTSELARLAPSGEPAPEGLDEGESPRSGEHLAAKGGPGRWKKGSYRSEPTEELEEKRGLILAKGGRARADERPLAPAADLVAGEADGARAWKAGSLVAENADGSRTEKANGSRAGKAEGLIAGKGGGAPAGGSTETQTANRAPDDRAQVALLGPTARDARATTGRPRLARRGLGDAAKGELSRAPSEPGAAFADEAGGRGREAKATSPAKKPSAPGGLLAGAWRSGGKARAGEEAAPRDGAAQAPERLGQTLAGNLAPAEPAAARKAVAKARATVTFGQRAQTDWTKAVPTAESEAGRIAKEKTQVQDAAAVLLADGLFWRAKDREVPFVRLTTEARGAVTDEAIDAAVVERYAAHGQARTVQAIYRIALPKGAEVRDLTIGPASATRSLAPSGEAVAAVPPGAEVWVRFRYRQRFQDQGEVQLPFTQSFRALPRSKLATRRRSAANLVVDLELSQAAQRSDLRWSSNRAPALVLNNGQAVRVSLREPWPVLHEAFRLRKVRIAPPPAQKPPR